MRLPCMLPAIILLQCYFSPSLASSISSLSKKGCPDKCGNVTIPYPFGIGSNCSANSSFTITCSNLTNPHKPILNIISLEVLRIYIKGSIIVNQHVLPLNCSESPATLQALPISLRGSPFTFSAKYNTLVNLGCEKSVWLQTNTTTVGGCMAICNANSTDTSCNGVNCCQTVIPNRLYELQYSYQSIGVVNKSSCGYAFPVDKKWLVTDYKMHKGLQKDRLNPFDKAFGFAPLVLEWEAPVSDFDSSRTYCQWLGQYPSNLLSFCYLEFYIYQNSYLSEFCKNPSRYPSFTSSLFPYYKYEYESTVKYCLCKDGFEGNPYLRRGCQDIDECRNATFAKEACGRESDCINVEGGFQCYYGDYPGSADDQRRIRNQIKIAFTVIGSVFGSFIFLLGMWRFGKVSTKLIIAIRKYKFYKRNGGLLLEQHLSTTDNGLEKTKIFTSNELAKATDHYNENRIIGRGGQGTVYKGMLIDGKIVAVKKSKKVNEGDLETFINEVVILSQINHRNVVKLLGCCLEIEVPLLVYEFIPNGTLFHHIHEPNEELPLTWEMRVRVAAEVAGALAYLHSASSAPIYHRDIKSTNILLDEKYRAKVSDFGTCRSVSIDQTHVTTRVLGTFGYLDPEYFQSSQFTEKSDVYSFGVVLVELLTGEKAVSTIRAESGKSLATHFLESMEENQLFDILDLRVISEGKTEEIVGIAELAESCLQLNGKRRPTMKDVSMCLEGIRRGLKEGAVSLQRSNHNRDNIVADLSEESSDFSLISATLDTDASIANN